LYELSLGPHLNLGHIGPQKHVQAMEPNHVFNPLYYFLYITTSVGIYFLQQIYLHTKVSQSLLRVNFGPHLNLGHIGPLILQTPIGSKALM